MPMENMSKRLFPRWTQAIVIVSFAAISWLLMQALHECGHILAAIVSGGTVTHVVLYPLAFSRTDVQPNPYPLFEVWAGPLFGMLFPFAVWRLLNRLKCPAAPFFRAFAGFCAIANGLYIAFGPNTEGMDTQVMLSLGCARWQLLVFGMPAIALGLWLLNGTGAAFGIGTNAPPVTLRTAFTTVLLLCFLLTIEIAANWFT